MPRYAITDIHGCLKTFRYLLENGIGLRKKDTLYLLGDYVNKGPDSRGVLDYIIQLQEAGYNVKCLRGNHDQLLLDAIDIGKGANWLPRADQKRTLQSFGVNLFEDIDPKYLRFIRSLPLFLKLKDYTLVHAGCDFTLPAEALFNDPYTLLNIKNFIVELEKLNGRKLLHGHKPVGISQLTKAISQDSSSVNLDTGCVYFKNPEFGVLTAFNLETRQTYFQTNIDKPYVVRKK